MKKHFLCFLVTNYLCVKPNIIMIHLRYMKNLLEKYTGHLLTLQGFIVVVVLSVGAITLSSNGQNILSLLASAGSSLSPTPVIFYFTPYESKTLQIGDTTQINVNVKTAIPINAVGVTIKFPQDLLEIQGVSKEKSFLDLWTEDTSIHEDVGTIHFSGGTTMPTSVAPLSSVAICCDVVSLVSTSVTSG